MENKEKTPAWVEEAEAAEKNGTLQEETGLVTSDDNRHFVADLRTAARTSMFCSFKAETPEEKKKLFKIANNPEFKIADMIGKTILAKDLYCEEVTLTNKETGETSVAPRIVIIDDKGQGYQSVSMGVFNAIKKVCAIFGNPTWKEPVKLTVVQKSLGKNRLFTFDME